jgi:excisionase family DNA binding protein
MANKENDKKLTVREAAKAMGVSMATIRRRIKTGELPAELEPGPYGETYFIRESDLADAASIVEVVPVTRELDVRDVQAMFQSIVQPLLNELAEQRRVIEQQNEKIEMLLEQVREKEERDQLLMEAIRSLQEQKKEANKPWWKKFFDG